MPHFCDLLAFSGHFRKSFSRPLPAIPEQLNRFRLLLIPRKRIAGISARFRSLPVSISGYLVNCAGQAPDQLLIRPHDVCKTDTVLDHDHRANPKSGLLIRCAVVIPPDQHMV